MSGADIRKIALAAGRFSGRADVASEKNEIMVDLSPVVLWKDAHEIGFDPIRHCGVREAQPRADPFDMRVYGDALMDAKSIREHHVGGFPGNPGRSERARHGSGDLTRVAVPDDCRGAQDVLGLVVIKSGGVDYGFNIFDLCRGQGLDR